MTGLSLVTKGFICDYTYNGEAPPPIIGGGGVIREDIEVEKPKPTVEVLRALTENTIYADQMKNVTIGVTGVSIKLGD